MRKLLLVIALIITISCLTINAQNSSDENSFQFVFLTDIHVEPELNAPEGFEKAIEKVNELNPDFVLTGGDLIMDALNQTKSRVDSLYQLYTKLQKEFTMPVYNTPGNHENFGFYKKDEVQRTDPDYGIKIYRRYIGQPYYSFEHKGWHFIVLNSVMETEDRRYRGGVSPEEIEWLNSDLNAVDAETPIVVSVHIPLITAMTQINDGALEPNPPGIVINNSKEVLSLFDDKNLKLVLQGHLHYLEDLYMSNKTHFITGGAVSAGWWKGPRGNMEEGFLLLTVKGDDFTWKYIDFGWEVEK